MKMLTFGIILLVSMSSSVHSYDGGFRALNCIGATIKDNFIEPLTVYVERSKLNISDRRISVKSIPDDHDNLFIRVIISGRNGGLAIDSNQRPYYKLNKKLSHMLENDRLKESNIHFEITTVGECMEAFN